MAKRETDSYHSKTAWLVVSSFELVGGVHYYGRIQFKGEDVNVDKRLTCREAARLNKIEGNRTYRAGDTCSRFDDRETLNQAAQQKFFELLVPRGAQLLLDGNPVYEPLKLVAHASDLAGQPEELVATITRLNEYVDKAEEIGWWEKDEKQMQKLCDEWTVLLETIVDYGEERKGAQKKNGKRR